MVGAGSITERSFLQNESGLVTFPNVDGILVTPHVTWLIACTKEVPALGIYGSPLDYGTFGPGVPLTDPVYVANPHSTRALPQEVVDAFYGAAPDPLGDPMSAPLDMIFWLGARGAKDGDGK